MPLLIMPGATRWTAAPSQTHAHSFTLVRLFVAGLEVWGSRRRHTKVRITISIVLSIPLELALRLSRRLGGLLLGEEVRSIAMLLAMLEDFFTVYVAKWLTMTASPHCDAALLVHHPGPRGPARGTATLPRAEPFSTLLHMRRGQQVGACA